MHDGERVRVVSQWRTVLPIRVGAEGGAGQLFATFQTKEFSSTP
jgi:hypothetical protein